MMWNWPIFITAFIVFYFIGAFLRGMRNQASIKIYGDQTDFRSNWAATFFRNIFISLALSSVVTFVVATGRSVLWGILAVIFLLMVRYFFRNFAKNSSPNNQECAQEIVEQMLDDNKGFGPDFLNDVDQIFGKHGRDVSQSLHVASMLPSLSKKEGVSREASLWAAKLISEHILQNR